MKQNGPVGSRGHAVAALIRSLKDFRHVPWKFLNQYVPDLAVKVHYLDHRDGAQIGLDAFINAMTALRCEVWVVPKDVGTGNVIYRIHELPDNEGRVLLMPEQDELPIPTQYKPQPKKRKRRKKSKHNAKHKRVAADRQADHDRKDE